MLRKESIYIMIRNLFEVSKETEIYLLSRWRKILSVLCAKLKYYTSSALSTMFTKLAI